MEKKRYWKVQLFNHCKMMFVSWRRVCCYGLNQNELTDNSLQQTISDFSRSGPKRVLLLDELHLILQVEVSLEYNVDIIGPLYSKFAFHKKVLFSKTAELVN